jgi:Zn-dependent protease with chaperone function
MGQERPPRGLLCPVCGTGLEPLDEGDTEAAPDAHRMVCPNCGETFRARRRAAGGAGPGDLSAGPPSVPPLVGSIALFWREAALRGVEWAYRSGMFFGSAGLFALGGFVPVVRAWLRDEIAAWGGVLEALGGVHVVTETRDPDADLGPVLARTDAPALFAAVNEVARRLGVKPPAQIRLTYLPCCGMVAWGHSQALVLGLPLLRVLTLAELRAIIAHELAHLARGDATRAARSARFVEGLRQALDRSGGREHGPLGVWARLCGRAASWLIGPIAWGQEARADRSAAAIAGGSAAAAALVKVAIVQPLFREVLEHYEPTSPGAPNLYAFFRSLWFRLPAEVHSAMRLRILADPGAQDDPAHPPLPDRLALLQAYPDPVQSSAAAAADSAPATSCLGDLEAFEQMLHNRLFGLPPVEPSIFHKAGT